IRIWAKSDRGEATIDFLQGDKEVSTMKGDVKAGMNRFQWNMRGAPPPTPPGAQNFAAGQGGGQGRGGRGGAAGRGPQRVTVGGQTLHSSVQVLEDIWMRPQ